MRRINVLSWTTILVLCLVGGWSPPVISSGGDIVVQDIFGRRLNENGLVLVDWEGYMANPAIKFFVTPPPTASFPATAVLSADNDRLYFDSPSQVGASGPTKTIAFAAASTRVPVYISNFPDRDTNDGHYHLTIQFTGADHQQTGLTLNVHEIDQDKPGTGPYAVTVDFSQDQTGFYADSSKRTVVQQAAADWAYFIDDMALDQVPAGAETSFIWPPADGIGTFVTNSAAYTGFLLYTYGVHHPSLTSGGGPAAPEGGFQSSGGIALPLRRSGGYLTETQGNYNTLGWFLTTGDDDWWVSGNFGNEPNDLFSIAHHEMGHAFIFNPGYPRFQQFKQVGVVQDAAVLAYHGSYPRIDPTDHMSGEIDNASRVGAYGNEYGGLSPLRRWLITKLDLLVAQAVGYKIRATSALTPLSVSTTTLRNGIVAVPYTDTVRAAGGIPFYNWTVDSGALPAGLSLDPFTGAISGTPTASGTFNFTARVQEYIEGAVGMTVPLSITVAVPPHPTIDYDGDGKADLSVYRPSTGEWFIRSSSSGYATWSSYQWGLPGDIPLTGDFDGDGQIELTVYRPSDGTWFIRYSSLGYNGAYSYQWGLPGDIPMAADFDGDGKAELTVWRPSNGTWYIRYSSFGYGAAYSYQWGLPGDIPIVSDLDGDRKAELTVWRPSDGTWYIRYSSFGYSAAYSYQWGLPGDTPLSGDFDGDGKTDLVVYRPSLGTWYLRFSSSQYSLATWTSYQWGLPGDVPVSADFDGDGRTDLAVWRPSTGAWFIRYSSSAYSLTNWNTFQWGLPSDISLGKK